MDRVPWGGGISLARSALNNAELAIPTGNRLIEMSGKPPNKAHSR